MSHKILEKLKASQPLSTNDFKAYKILDFKGAFSYDEFLRADFDRGFYVVNTDTKQYDGQHWVACYTMPHEAFFFYDPLGLPTRNGFYVREGFEASAEHNLVPFYNNVGYPSQNEQGFVCGHACMRWMTQFDAQIERSSNVDFLFKQYLTLVKLMHSEYKNMGDVNALINFFTTFNAYL